MDLLLTTRLDGLFVATLNIQTLTLMRHSVQSSNHPPFELSSALPSPALGPSINSMSRTSFFMAILMRVYCQQPSSFVDPANPNHVCRLHKSLYGLKQAPRAWYQHFATYIRIIGFVPSVLDTSLFVLKDGKHLARRHYSHSLFQFSTSASHQPSTLRVHHDRFG